MSLKIDQDHGRFRQIVRGRIRQNLRKYISQGELIGRKGKDLVSIPIPQIDIPRFRFGDKQRGGLGQGDGNPGDPVSGDEKQPGKGEAGSDAGDHLLEVDVTLDELAAILGEELELPDIEDKGKSKISSAHDKYSGIRRVGPESLRHFKRTYREALKRMIASGSFRPDKPMVVPIPDDKRYRSWKTITEPVANAVIVYMMDVSGSMGDEQKEIVRIESFWIDAWLTKQYKGLESRFIIHDAIAREVDRDTFFHTRESGGTMISSAYKLCSQIIDSDYPPDEWNIYPFHFSDGDNWSMDDTLACVELMKQQILPRVNMFAYGQVESPYGSGQFIKDLKEHFAQDDRVVVSEIRDKDAVVGSIKDFLGRGNERPMSKFALKTALPRYLAVEKEKIEKVARSYGLDFFPTIFEMLTYDQMNEIAAYGGFPSRYPHWRFGMEYEQLAKSYEYGLSKIYEMVINNNPSYAYLLEGNSLTDQKLVMAHVFGHVDFFKNNFCFRATDLDQKGAMIDPVKKTESYDPDRKWIDKMANHGSRISRHIERHGINKVELYIDQCLSLENLIDPWAPFTPKPVPRDMDKEEEPDEVPKLQAKEYMDAFINPEEYLEEQRQKRKDAKPERRVPERPERDVLKFLLDHAPLERWERDILEVVREEAYYFVPQMQTKVMNEGWACLSGITRVFTDRGVVSMADLVGRGEGVVCDGERERRVYDKHLIRDHETITVTTRRGLALCGSNNHRVLLNDRVTWKRLDELSAGDRVAISGGNDLWAEQEVALSWSLPVRVTLRDVAAAAGVSRPLVSNFRQGKRVSPDAAVAVSKALETYDHADNQRISTQLKRRAKARIPELVTRELGAFLGYLVGDGHVSRVKHHIGLTTGDEPQATNFMDLVWQLFELPSVIRWDEGRWRVFVHSETVSDFLVEAIGLTTGPSAREKRIPDVILRSPEPVVRAFLRAYFDCDAYAGKQGVILSTMSDALAEQTQLLLLNFGILSRRRRQKDGCWHVHIAGESVRQFIAKIGFGLSRKKEQLERYIQDHSWFKPEKWEDEVVSLERGRADVYDISVEETHRYAAGGFINHNSYWHSKLMTEKILDASEIIEYADHNAGVMATSPGRLNPYKIGVELYRYIEDRWNKGRFGREWEECMDLDAKRSWDMHLGLGRQKIFQVRSLYNDVTFIDEFLTPEFCVEMKMYTFGFSGRNDRFEIESREFKEVKEKMLFQLTNFGNPYIRIIDANYANRGELLLEHQHAGMDLRADYARETLSALVRVWKRPVCVATKVENKPVLIRYDGKEHSTTPYKV